MITYIKTQTKRFLALISNSHISLSLSFIWLRNDKYVNSYFEKVVGKNVHATIPKGKTGYDQYTVPHTAAVEPPGGGGLRI